METEDQVYVKDAFGRDILKKVEVVQSRERSRSRDSSSSSDESHSSYSDTSDSDERESGHYWRSRHRGSRHSRHSDRMEKADRMLPHIVLANTTPRMSFQQFMYRQRNDITPEEAHSRFVSEQAHYDQEVAHRFFETYCHEEFMLERYLPSYRLNRLRDLSSEIRDAHTAMCEEIASGSFLKKEEMNAVTIQSPYRNRLDDSWWSCVVYFESVPSGCSRSEFRKLLPAEANVKTVWFGDVMVCPPPGIARPVWVLCGSKEDASLVVDQLDGSSVEYMSDIFTNDKSKWRIACRCQMRPKRSHMLPTVANRPDRIASDLASLLQILHTLEKYWELDTSLEPCLSILADQVSDFSDVDRVYVLVHVLRRVFGYDYWHSAANQEFGVSFHRFGFERIRASGECEEENEKDQAWCAALDKNTSLFIESMTNRSLSKELNASSPELEKEKEIRQEETTLLEQLIDASEDHYACKVCDKYFNGREFVVKHIQHHHNAKVEGVTMIKVMKEVCEPLYQKDDTKVMPVVIDSRTNRARYCNCLLQMRVHVE